MQKCTVWCAVSATGIVSTVLLTSTLISEHYQEGEEGFLQFHQGMHTRFEETFFQQ